jgi:hypothetical protein
MTLWLFKTKVDEKNPRYGSSAKKIDLMCKYIEYFKRYFMIIPSEYFELHYGELRDVIDTYSNMAEDWKSQLSELKTLDVNPATLQLAR